MGHYFEKKRENLDLVLKTIGEPGAASEDGSFAGKPPLLWLESTARCNLRCGKCGHAVDAPGSARILPRNLADAVVDEADEYFAAAVKVRTSGYGEMFLFSRLRSLVERIKRFGCWVEGTTNGVIIDPTEVDWLVQLGYDQLVFSIDGVEPATMRRLRGADLDRIWDILGYIRRKKEEWNSAKPQIVVGFVAQADNLHELPALVRKLAGFNICLIAVNTLHYKKYVPGTEDPYGKLYHDFSLANLERAQVEAVIEEARRLAAEANIGYNVYIDLDRVYREAAEDAGDEDGELVPLFAEPVIQPPVPLEPFYCIYPWTSLFVTARGSTSVCCSMRGDIGTVLESGDLDRVWNGEPLREIRKAITKGEVHKSCAYCVSRNRHLSSFVDLDAVKAALSAREDAPPAANATPEPTPDAPLFGYFDTLDLNAPSAGRLRVSGWMASGQHGTPLRELKLRLDGQELAVVRHFYDRPDVAAHYGRKDLLHSGWQVLVNLPALLPGEYELVAEGVDPEGMSGTLGPLPVRITG